MPIKYKNGTVAKENDPVVGIDWRGGVVKGFAIKGDAPHAELVFQHGEHKTVCPSLALENFLLASEAIIKTDGVPSVTAKPASATAEA